MGSQGTRQSEEPFEPQSLCLPESSMLLPSYAIAVTCQEVRSDKRERLQMRTQRPPVSQLAGDVDKPGLKERERERAREREKKTQRERA